MPLFDQLPFEKMGGCATKPKELDAEELPEKKPTSHEDTPRDADENLTIENKVDAENENEDSLFDASEPKQDAPKADGETKAEQDTPVTDLVSEKEASNPESTGPAKVPEIVPEVAKDAGVKEDDVSKDSKNAVAEQETKIEKPENLNKVDVKIPAISA